MIDSTTTLNHYRTTPLPHSHTLLLTHSLTHTLSYSHIHLLTHSLTHTFTYSHIHLRTHSLTRKFTYSLTTPTPLPPSLPHHLLTPSLPLPHSLTHSPGHSARSSPTRFSFALFALLRQKTSSKNSYALLCENFDSTRRNFLRLHLLPHSLVWQGE